MAKYSLILLLPILLLSKVSIGQDQNTRFKFAKDQNTRFKLSRSISLHEDSKKENIFIKVEEQTMLLELQIVSKLRLGELTIEIYNPAGERQGNYSVGSQTSGNGIKKSMNGIEKYIEEYVHGEINKHLIGPLVGEWRVTILPKKAKGDVIINTVQFMHE